MNDNQTNRNGKAKGPLTIKKNNIMFKAKKGIGQEEQKVNATPISFGRNLNANVKPGAMKAFSPIPQRYNSNFEMSNKRKLK